MNLTRIDLSPFNRLSPYFLWGDVPIPYSGCAQGVSLHSIWEGLKVFELSDIDMEFIKNPQQGIRSENEFGILKGFRRGIYGEYIFSEIEARERIYIKIYKWILENKAYNLIYDLRQISYGRNIILIDSCINCNIEDLSTPISTAFLVKSYIQGTGPFQDICEERKVHHYYAGRKVINWTTSEKYFKKIPPISDNCGQLEIEFDY